jgi:ATP-dependent DNA helicase RecG
MTATPIPRTLALSIFGNLNLSIVDELPKGRKPIKTFLKVEKERSEVYKHLRQEITNGRQVYVICPKINPKLNEEDMTDTNNEIRSVNLEIENLKKIFEKDNFIIESIHGKINSEERDQIMERFQNGETQILVATSLIEVGVNIPNASIMIIENSERFGMSQLHQLRGRIGRGEHESTCYVFTNSNNEASIERLRKFTSTNNGFELAEIDMKQRGIGSLLSRNQSGLSDIGMLALQNLKLVEIAKSHARQILTEDIKLENFPELKARLNQLEKAHME